LDLASYIQETIEGLSKSCGILNDLTGIVDRDEHQYIGGGTFGDVYKGIWRSKPAGREHPEVAVKVLRLMGSVKRNGAAKCLKVPSELTGSLNIPSRY